ncbi:hypothetical protein Tco_0852228 [Tanacetum coccineum]|uniref:Uncharacterized protein n=1 Tax=Tanacetum coccineum TaxID=301880 RepID=A0ABQ5ETX5_9ASTR
MSSDGALSVVTYTSVSSEAQSWSIPTEDPYEEADHAPVYVLEPEHPKYHVPSDDDIQVEDQPHIDDASPTAESPGYIADLESMKEDYIDYPDKPEAGEEDHEEDLSE